RRPCLRDPLTSLPSRRSRRSHHRLPRRPLQLRLRLRGPLTSPRSRPYQPQRLLPPPRRGPVISPRSRLRSRRPPPLPPRPPRLPHGQPNLLGPLTRPPTSPSARACRE